MFGFVLAILAPLLLYGIAAKWRTERDGRLIPVLMLSYGVRIFFQLFVRNLTLFSHGGGGDSEGYEELALLVSRIWGLSGVHYVKIDELPAMGTTTLPPNLFGMVFYLNNGPTRLGCTALVALAATLTFLNVYRLAVQFGAKERDALRVILLLMFAPATLLYTSDLYKDGLVLLFVVGALGSAIRLSRKFTFVHAIIGISCILALWGVRFYLVFLALTPLVVGLLGMSSKSLVRPVGVALLVSALAIGVSAYTSVVGDMATTANQTFTLATSRDAIADNATGGSGVTFDDGGSPYRALAPKMLYTLFSPFPWQSGSTAFHLGKIDALLWYYLVYRSIRSMRRLLREDAGLLLTVLSFVIPTTVVYAMTMANIGLIVRQRMPIVVGTALLAALSYQKDSAKVALTSTGLAAQRILARARARRAVAPGE